MRFAATRAMVSKDVLVTWRSPLFAIISILVPVAFTLLYAVVIHVSTTATIAIADQDSSAVSRRLVEIMRTMGNDDGAYYEILSTEPSHARQLYASGQVGALLTIPAGFGTAVETGQPAEIGLALININADGTKNQHLRLEQAMREFDTLSFDATSSRLVINEDGVWDHDIPITVYLGAALLVFAALYSGIVNAGVAIAREWEDRTAKSLVLSPSGPLPLIAGKWLASFIISLATVVLAALGIGAVLGFPLTSLGPHSGLVLLVVWLYGVGIGTLLGVAFRKSLPLIPVAVIVAVGHFLVSGYESYIRGFAHGGIVEALWRATAWIPLGPLFDSVRLETSDLPQPATLPWALAATVALALGLAAIAARGLSRTGTFTQGQ